MKLSVIGLSALLGSLVSLTAIERPGGGTNTEKVPAKPQGGILEKDQKAEAPKPAEMPQEKGNEAVREKVAYLGVGGEEASEALRVHLDLAGGLLLSTIAPQSPAGLAGLAENDIIVSVDGEQLTDQESLRQALAAKKPGDEVSLKLIRRGKSIEQKVTLGEAPAMRNIQPQALIPNQAADMHRLLNQQLGNALGGLGDDDLQKELMEQLNKAFGDAGIGGRGGLRQLRLDLGGDLLDGEDFKMGFQGLGSMRFEDGEGSIELKMKNGKRELAIRDKAGELLFEGPYDSDIDKAAVPEEHRERVERLDNGNGNTFRFNFNGEDLFKRGDKTEEKGD